MKNNNNKIIKKYKKFNKIIITSNNGINLEQVCEDLYKNFSGKLSKPKKSLNYNYSPEKISEILLNEAEYDENGEIQISRIWEPLILDLFLANKDNDLTVWCDNKAIELLSFFRNLDEKIFFILVYDSPFMVIKKSLKQGKNKETILEELNKWEKEVRHLLNFYYKNQDSVLLINYENFKINKTEYIKELSNKLNIGTLIDYFNETNQNKANVDLILDYFITQYLINSSDNYKILDLYNEIESFAFNPNIRTEVVKSVDFLEYAELFVDLHRNIENQKKELEKSLKTKEEEYRKKIQEAEKEKELLLAQLMTTQEELEKFYLEKDTLSKNIESLKNENIKIKTEKEKLNAEKEKELLLAQLMTTQEELEKFYLENKKLKSQIEEKKRYYGAAERIKSQLSYRIGNKMIEVAKNKPLLLPFLPFILLNVRKEYKKYMKNRPMLPPIHTYADYYEAERVKQHLSYMLGETTIKTMKNNPFGIFILPFRLRKTYKIFKQQRKQ